jgi:hypothetical protein
MDIHVDATRHDVFIAIGKYKDNLIPDILCCENDAELIMDVLEKVPFINNNKPNQITLSTNINPEVCTKTNILNVIGQLSLEVKQDDMLLLMISCHGYSHNDETYLIPQDAVLGDVSTYISFTWIKEILDDVYSKFKVILVDACHSGDSTIKFKSAAVSLKFKEETKIINQLLKESHGLCYATSCKHNQVALIQPDGKYSIWFSSLANAITTQMNLGEDDIIRLDAVLSSCLYQTTLLADKYWSCQQTPFCVLKIEGLLPLGLKLGY